MGENNSMDLSSTISWTVKLEEYFASTGEKANGLAWVHKRSEAIYSNRRTYIDLPVIIGSGVIAFLNAGSQSLFPDQRIASTALGVGSLFMGILNSFGTYFGWSKRAEGHRISAIHYAKLYRFISVELRLPRAERMPPSALLKYVKDQYDRLSEISPLLPSEVVREFQNKFNKPEYKTISKPEEANGLEHIQVYNPPKDEIEESVTGVMSPTPKSPPNTMVMNTNKMFKPKDLPKLRTPSPAPIEEVKQEIVSEEEIRVEVKETKND
jgi:hypothetical protein